jgi:hypothetical protein
MLKIFNKDGFNWWIGVVENRQDPEKLGRCKVRVFGYHTDNKELLPTKDLPWAVPIQPITSAATSGKGSSPLGPVEGTWVLGFYLDGEDMQQPAMLGTIATKAAGLAFTETQEIDSTTNPSDGVIKDKNGEPVKDEAGNNTFQGTPNIEGYHLGIISETLEAGNTKDPGVINGNKGAGPYVNNADFGGASYGLPQITTNLPPTRPDGKQRPPVSRATMGSYLKKSKFKDQFTGLTPNTPAFDAKWKELARTKKEEFADDQRSFKANEYYRPVISNLQRKGIDLTKYGPAVQEAAIAFAVAMGAGGAASMIFRALKGISILTDKDIINLIHDHIINNMNIYYASSPALHTSLINRYKRQKDLCLGYCK